MPGRARAVCCEPGCPNAALSDARGRCATHRLTTTGRGYGSDWQAFSLTLRRERGACEDCGSRQDLTVDHVEPHSGARGYRVRCRSCHAKYGAKGGMPNAPELAAPVTERSAMVVIG